MACWLNFRLLGNHFTYFRGPVRVLFWNFESWGYGYVFGAKDEGSSLPEANVESRWPPFKMTVVFPKGS